MNNKLSKWYGYPCELWYDLAGSSAVSHMLNANGIPSTVVLQSMYDIGSTTNRKFRNRKVDTLVATLTKLSSKLVSALQDVADTLSLNHICSDELPEVHVWTKDNSPAYLPYLVGDSSYWSSCLCTGILNAVVRGDVCYDDIDWVSSTYDTILGLGFQPGSNSEYLRSEYNAFHDGGLVYLTVGKFFNEDVNGPRARMRVHLGTIGNQQFAVMDRAYSSNYNEVIALYAKARELYGDILYSVDYNHGTTLDTYNTVYLPLTGGVYTDYDEGFKVVDTLTRQVGSVHVVTTRRVRSIERFISISTNNVIVSLRGHNYIEAKHRDLVTTAMFVQGANRMYMDSVVTTVIRKLLNYVGLLCDYNTDDYYNTVKPHDNIQLKNECIQWVARGHKYSLSTSLCLVRRKVDAPFKSLKLYDSKHNKWVQHYDQSTDNSCYQLTRHTIHMIYKFLPYAKYESNKVRPMPVV